MLIRIVRSDGAIIAGPYPAGGLQSLSFVDIPPAGNWTYSIQAEGDYGFPNDYRLETRLTMMSVKR